MSERERAFRRQMLLQLPLVILACVALAFFAAGVCVVAGASAENARTFFFYAAPCWSVGPTAAWLIGALA